MKLKDKLKSFSEEVGEDKIEKLIGYSSLRGLIMSIQKMAQEIDEEIEDELSNLVQKIEKKWQDLQNQDLNNTENTKSELNTPRPEINVPREVEAKPCHETGQGDAIQNEINKDYVKEVTKVKEC